MHVRMYQAVKVQEILQFLLHSFEEAERIVFFFFFLLKITHSGGTAPAARKCSDTVCVSVSKILQSVRQKETRQKSKHFYTLIVKTWAEHVLIASFSVIHHE